MLKVAVLAPNHLTLWRTLVSFTLCIEGMCYFQPFIFCAQTEDDFWNNLVIQKLQDNHEYFVFPQERNPKTLNPLSYKTQYGKSH
jgi:hypothetical protein